MLKDEFLLYLTELDKANEKCTLQTYLNFVMKCDQLRKEETLKSKEAILSEMCEFFNNPNRSKRLALRNEVTREECKKYFDSKIDGKKIPQNLWDAEAEAQRHLADHYQNFLKKRNQEKNGSMMACLL